MKVETPIGAMDATVDGEGRLVELHFGAAEDCPPPTADCKPVIDQLNDYFSGKRKTFELTLAPRGTPFQLAVWNALLEIPYGDTISYAELARRIGKPSAVRAVGAANGANPIPVIIPCHRVIGSNGSLTGYGGGIERKQWLLALEGRRLF
ncbi:MAG TPA: methylated-DNA--[protein]-cysteine S-methyltransferase [Thermoanaerobaculia bacterium]|jgi:methylated-DNA-[protein]-cysteine S-methyltransferase|nr:methylated-DNA--[protein]-cysteine S-methyltransferase [Thermoanaerobaculia bacterium]